MIPGSYLLWDFYRQNYKDPEKYKPSFKDHHTQGSPEFGMPINAHQTFRDFCLLHPSPDAIYHSGFIVTMKNNV